ncbi:ArsR/SmtB family transcription factor [Fimbriiglobus ruber]|uniref:HTH arsR-type domain-containing protein n=1 Tax=Fimbriiglobus ruber TaxID=1908690 RepID=A0A225DGC5_9BACT|nr:metalloregulator ArsR/SmtB family transcription factor [Fimbriiglobus ruber]OWK40522.1 hypothetical protein FRUB_05441 [Fimbriiglobus ruber]
MTDYNSAKQCAGLLSAMAETTRILIIEELRASKKNVTELAKLLNTEIVNISHHLGVLRQAGLVKDEKFGRFVEYSLNPEYFGDDGSLEFGWCRVELK